MDVDVPYLQCQWEEEAPGSSCRTLSGELLDSQPQIRNDLGLKSAIQDKVLRSLPN